MIRFRQSGLPILGWSLFTAETDDERLLGKPGQYSSKVSFSDRRLAAGGGTEASNLDTGGVSEVFATPADAARRARRLGGGSARVARHGRFLLRLSPRLGPGAAAGYEAALAKLPG